MKTNGILGLLADYNVDHLLGLDVEGWAQIQRKNKALLIPQRQKLLRAIDHQSHDDLASLIGIVKENAHSFTIITHYDLKEVLSYFSANGIRTAALILEKEGAQETMLFLLGHVKYYHFGTKLYKIPHDKSLKQ